MACFKAMHICRLVLDEPSIARIPPSAACCAGWVPLLLQRVCEGVCTAGYACVISAQLSLYMQSVVCRYFTVAPSLCRLQENAASGTGSVSDTPLVHTRHFQQALQRVAPSVSKKDQKVYDALRWQLRSSRGHLNPQVTPTC